MSGGRRLRLSVPSRACRGLIAVLSMAGLVSCCAAEDRAAAPNNRQRSSIPLEKEAKVMKVRLTINGKSMIATLDDSASARDFLSMLPLALTLDDYAATEKIADLPKKLTTQGAPAGVDPDVGDIAYYAPWGNLAIFYRDAGYAKGLVRLGRIDSGVEALNVRGSLKVTIEAVGQ
jgi:hypothetical protein